MKHTLNFAEVQAKAHAGATLRTKDLFHIYKPILSTETFLNQAAASAAVCHACYAL